MRRTIDVLLPFLAIASTAWMLAAGHGARAQAPSRGRTSPYAERVAQAIAASLARDWSRAAQLLREAVELEPSRPDAYGLLGAVHRQRDALQDAVESFRTCARMARQTTVESWEARCLHGIASTLERIPERLEEARAAWNELVRFLDVRPEALVAAPHARARVSAIDTVLEQERVYVEVRQRIAERARAAGATSSVPAR
ncbi:MAG: hypothetical protein RMK74_11215 [Myxococcales bacterium]|nr:hypothetical protein [Myxococcales bacterium]